MPRVLIVGCGFVGEQAADRFHAAGWEVSGWTGSADSAARLGEQKVYPIAAHDVTDPAAVREAAAHSPTPDVVVMSVSSGRGGGPEQYRRVYLGGARNLLAAFCPARFVFTGSTSVYAQTDGAWLDECSPAVPDRETGRVLRETEDAVLASSGGVVARLAGIYGPGRSNLLRKFLSGEAVVEGDGGRWLNQIHRDDAASALLCLAQRDTPPGVYNVADDQPVTQLELYASLAGHFGRALPPSGPVDLHRKRGWTSKRVANGRLRALGWRPVYPSFLAWASMQVPGG